LIRIDKAKSFSWSIVNFLPSLKPCECIIMQQLAVITAIQKTFKEDAVEL